MSMYGRYIKERAGRDIIESDHAFATYCYVDDGCYIGDVWVEPEHRMKKSASTLLDIIAIKAKEHGSKYLFATVDPKAKGTTTSIMAMLKYGFELTGTDGTLIYFKQDL